MRCDSCEVLVINGLRCHETGCPDSWRDETRQCRWCGSAFEPIERDQRECDESCHCAYHGYPEPENA